MAAGVALAGGVERTGALRRAYFWAQMFLWWPLWDVNRWAWAVFGALFVVNTVLNLRGHFDDE